MSSGQHNLNYFGDVEKGQTSNQQWGDFSSAFSEHTIRIQFIRKVYLILTSQLIFTFGVICVFVFAKPVKDFAHTDMAIYFYIASYFAFIAMIITFFIFQCFKLNRKTPYNYILLIGFTLTLTYMLSMISAYHDIQAVLMAIGSTFLITLGVTLFSLQTKFDFTEKCWLPAICLLFAFTGFGICTGIGYRYGQTMQGVYGGIGAVIMALFLAIDTQALLGSKRFSYSPEDYIDAALQIYFDICYIFLYLLRMFASK